MKITLNAANRKPLVELISNFMGEAAVYMRAPSYAYSIGSYTVTRAGDLEIPDDTDAEALRHLYSVLESEGYHPQEPLPQPEAIGLTVTMPKDKVNIDNLNALLDAKGILIKKALGIGELPVRIGTDTVSFPWFAEMPDPDSVPAFTRFISDICEMSIRQDWSGIYRVIGMLPHAGFNGMDDNAVQNAGTGEAADSNAEAEESVDESLGTGENATVNESTSSEESTVQTTEMDGDGEAAGQDMVGDKTSPENTGITEAPGLSADILNRLDSLRVSLVREINRQFNEIIRSGCAATPHRNIPVSRGNAVPAVASGDTMSITLYGDINALRGTKPTLVRYGEDSIPVTSWKRAFAAVLDICNRQESYHEALLAARNETMGRGRKVMADSPQGMLSPLKIDDGLYVETNFSTEALLKLLRDRILSWIDFDARDITFEYWRP